MSVPILFDRKRLRQRRAPTQDFLRQEALHQAQDALDSITRIFPRMVTFGTALPARKGTSATIHTGFDGQDVVADEELLPFAESSVDAVVSVWGLHWVNDLPGTLSQIRRMLKPDGLFLAVMPGAETLRELRQSLSTAEAELTGGMRARVAPFPDVREAGALLQRIGFTLPVASSEMLTATYPDMTALMHDLRAMGENSMLADAQKTFTPRRMFERAAQHYETFRSAGRLSASFEFLTLMGWKPA